MKERTNERHENTKGGPNQMAVQLTETIRSETRRVQALTLGTGFTARLFAGQVSRDEYTYYLFNLYVVYRALENALSSSRDNSLVSRIYAPLLHRSAVIRDDLDALAGRGWVDFIPLRSADLYVAYIHRLTADHRELLTAHAYARYVTDLTDGQLLRQVLKRRYGFADDVLATYRYQSLSIRDELDAFRERFDQLNLQNEERYAFINEVAMAYLMMLGISMELERARHSMNLTMTASDQDERSNPDRPILNKDKSKGDMIWNHLPRN